MHDNNPYLDLSTYTEIYQELVYQRNEVIRFLEENALLDRNKQVFKSDEHEWTRHKIAVNDRALFREAVLALFDRLYSHDAVEAIYDFNSVELGSWTNTEANMLERELQRLQMVISKLETRYHLQYHLVFEYVSEKCLLYLNGIEVFSCGQSTLRHRLLTTLFSKPKQLWANNDVEQYFVNHFNYTFGDLTDKNIEKAARDIQKDVASKTAVNDLLIVSNSSVRVNPTYI